MWVEDGDFVKVSCCDYFCDWFDVVVSWFVCSCVWEVGDDGVDFVWLLGGYLYEGYECLWGCLVEVE